MSTTTTRSNLDARLELLFARRSVRVYSPGDISDETVHKLLEAAMAAPSAMTKDPWRFIVVRKIETLSRLAAVLPGGKMLSTATLAIVVCGDLEAAFENHLSYLLQDCSAATENLLLAAQALGLGGCWVGVHPLEDAIRQLRPLLDLPGSFVPMAVISLGLPGEAPEPRTRYNGACVRAEQWHG